MDLEKYHAAVSGGSAGGWQLTNKGARLRKGFTRLGLKIKNYFKDLRLIMEAVAEVNMPPVGTTAVQRMYKSLETEGLIEMDTQAVIKTAEKLADGPLV